jgi:CRP/FNR family cyclic AMP-dependent transcriptional regulator
VGEHLQNQGAAALLRSNEFFGGLSSAALQEIVALGYSKPMQRGEVLYLQGDPGTALYLIVSGTVLISASSVGGQEMHLNTLVSGDVMGEIALLDGGTRTATATVTEDGMAFCVERAEFLRLLKREPEITTQLLQLVCQRVRWTSGLLEDSVFLSAEARLAKRLLHMGESSGAGSDEQFEVHLSQTELARHLYVTRQVVNQLLQALQKDGIVSIGHRKVVIEDTQALLARTKKLEGQ